MCTSTTPPPPPFWGGVGLRLVAACRNSNRDMYIVCIFIRSTTFNHQNRVKTSNFGRTCKIGHHSTSPDITSFSRPRPIDEVLFRVDFTDKISSYPIPTCENGTHHIIIDQLDIHSSLVTSSSEQFREHMVLLLVTTILNSIFYR